MAPTLYQFEHPWHWLTSGQNATAIAVLISFIVSLVTIIVLIRTFVAVNRQAVAADRQAIAAEEQAKVARKQTEVAEEQRLLAERATAAAEEQVKASSAATAVSEAQRVAAEQNAKAAQFQGELIRHQLLAQLRPILVVRLELATPNHGDRYVLQNHGQGVASEISAIFRRVTPLEAIQVSQTILGPQQDADISASLTTLPERGFQIRYKSQDGRNFVTYAEPWDKNPKGFQQVTMETNDNGGWKADPAIPGVPQENPS
ncbi:hypothetical protein FTO74_08660 [Granulicella sp. WH15]|uniref:hypothetical protein n=1 Tax=Granulicella sp. WH15 TaxID=2602070 RepID=UPI001366D158|nr:hypothetical protein [Granulicella sp. WH15]QHN03427.1 hypothetical protein FTO74_08660 [Granulicella sp. WH15]